jgi:hypothetical protein
MSRPFFFSGLFPSPHAPVGWVRVMIFSLILLASRPQQYNPIGLAYFSFLKRASGFNYIIKSFSATKKSNEFTKFIVAIKPN